MKRLLAVIAVAVVAWLGWSSASAAPPPPCITKNEQLMLVPMSASYNGKPAEPTSAGSAVYVTDAGVQVFVVSLGELTTVRDETSAACPRPVEQVMITVVDPWTGERFTISTRGTP